MKIQSERYVHRLVIPSARMSDAGQYSVVAGGNMSTANLHVEGREVRITSTHKEIQVIVFKVLHTDSPAHMKKHHNEYKVTF